MLFKNIPTLLILLMCSALATHAQQFPLSQQSIYEPTFYNPALVGSQANPVAYANHRWQWMGFGNEGIHSSILGGMMPIKKLKMGLGLQLELHQEGLLIDHYKLSSSYAYNIIDEGKHRFFAGLTAYLDQLRLDYTKAIVYDINELDALPRSQLRAGVGLGLYYSYYRDEQPVLSFSLMLPHMIQGRTYLTNTSEQAPYNHLRAHIQWQHNFDNVILEPTINISDVVFDKNINPQGRVDTNIRFYFPNLARDFWVAGGVRTDWRLKSTGSNNPTTNALASLNTSFGFDLTPGQTMLISTFEMMPSNLSVFGPSMEIGIVHNFKPRKTSNPTIIDFPRRDFWRYRTDLNVLLREDKTIPKGVKVDRVETGFDYDLFRYTYTNPPLAYTPDYHLEFETLINHIAQIIKRALETTQHASASSIQSIVITYHVPETIDDLQITSGELYQGKDIIERYFLDNNSRKINIEKGKLLNKEERYYLKIDALKDGLEKGLEEQLITSNTPIKPEIKSGQSQRKITVTIILNH